MKPDALALLGMEALSVIPNEEAMLVLMVIKEDGATATCSRGLEASELSEILPEIANFVASRPPTYVRPMDD
jgi:hypothetical protein